MMRSEPKYINKTSTEYRQAIRDSFERIYEDHHREVWAVIFARWMDSDSALDVTQEAFLRLWKQLESGESIQNPRAWLIRVARNLAEDFAKSAFRRHGTQSTELLSAIQVGVNGDSSPLHQLEQNEVFEQVREMLEELPAPDREILTLRYALDYDAPVIAEMLNVAVSAIHMRLSRARQRLAEKLSALGVNASS